MLLPKLGVACGWIPLATEITCQELLPEPHAAGKMSAPPAPSRREGPSFIAILSQTFNAPAQLPCLKTTWRAHDSSMARSDIVCLSGRARATAGLHLLDEEGLRGTHSDTSEDSRHPPLPALGV